MSADPWTKYWASGALDSCPEHASLYSEYFCQFWQATLNKISFNNELNILDLATGNGVVPSFIAKNAKSHSTNAQIIGIDKAKISPEKYKSFTEQDQCKVRFMSSVDAAKMPFKDNQFNWVTSQFGIEYSELDASLIEVLRVLAFDGTLTLICHHVDSQIIQRNTQLLEYAKKLLQQYPVFKLTKQLVIDERKLQQAPCSDNEKSLRGSLDALSQIINTVTNCTGDELAYYNNAVMAAKHIYANRSAMTIEQVIGKLEFAENALVESIGRLTELVNCALNDQKIKLIKKICADNKAQLTIQKRLRYQGVVVGIHIEAIKCETR